MTEEETTALIESTYFSWHGGVSLGEAIYRALRDAGALLYQMPEKKEQSALKEWTESPAIFATNQKIEALESRVKNQAIFVENQSIASEALTKRVDKLQRRVSDQSEAIEEELDAEIVVQRNAIEALKDKIDKHEARLNKWDYADDWEKLSTALRACADQMGAQPWDTGVEDAFRLLANTIDKQ
jgi:uncharacterized coiled-coil protein SlyX